jgi:hypothetical protein
MTFQDQYKHPKWQKRRLEILERDDFTCQKCGDTETMLHVHHKVYHRNRKVWDYKDFDLTTLCKHCHTQIDKIKPLKNEFNKIRIYKSNNWQSKTYIMFVVIDDILSMEVYDVHDSFVLGFNFSLYELYEIRKLMNILINKRKNV